MIYLRTMPGENLGDVLGGDAVEVQVHLLPGGQRPRLRAVLNGEYGSTSVHRGRHSWGHLTVACRSWVAGRCGMTRRTSRGG